MKDFFSYSITHLIGIIVLLVCLTVALILLRDLDFSSQLKNPASVYEIGELINDEYQVVATDNKNTLWLQKLDDNCTYVAVASSDYPNLSRSERLEWLWNTSLKESVSIKITEQVEK